MFSVSRKKQLSESKSEVLFDGKEISDARTTAETIQPEEVPHPDLQLVNTDTDKCNRNGVALALGGGVARGWAHIGVLRAIEEAEIPISMIAGTSIGAVVGGCYLAGKLDELEEFARSITRRNILRYIDFSFGGDGLVAGNRLAQRLEEELSGINIEDLDRRFIAVATEIDTGHEIWLEDGSLASAIRASYAMPGVFQPVNVRDRLLVDGALVNPVPVSACRAFEHNIVIAVNLDRQVFGRSSVVRSTSFGTKSTSSEAHQLENVPTSWLPFGFGGSRSAKKDRLGFTGVMIEAFNIIQDRIVRSRQAGDPPDFIIRPKLSDIGFTDFHRAAESIDLGYKEAKTSLATLEESGLREAMAV